MFKNSRRTWQNPSEPGAILGIPEPLLTFPEGFPEPGSLCTDPIAFCRWGKRVICNPQKFHHPHLQTSAATPQKLQLQHLFFLGRKSLPFVMQSRNLPVPPTRQAIRGPEPQCRRCIFQVLMLRHDQGRLQGLQGVAIANGVFWDQKIYRLYRIIWDPKDFFLQTGNLKYIIK